MNLERNKISEPDEATGRRGRPVQTRREPLADEKIKLAWLVLLTALAMTVLEGAFRKWVFPQGGAVKYLLYFSKDIIFATILFLPKRSQPSLALESFSNCLLPGCVLIGLGAIASCQHGFNPVGSILTIRALIVLPVIAWLVVPRLAGLPLRWVAGLLTVFVLLNFALGMEQNRLPKDHWLNHYADAEMEVVELESGVRATGTFAYIAGLGVISTVGIWAGLALMSVARSQWQRLWGWVALVAGFGCGLASISRAPIVIAAAMVAGWLVSFRDSVSLLIRGLVMGLVCLGLAFVLGLAPAFSHLWQGLEERANQGSDSFNQRAFGSFGETLVALQAAPFGNGFGTEQIGGQYYATGAAGFNHFESTLPRLVMETGLLGLIGYFVVAAGVIMALQTAKLGASPGAKSALLATQLFLGVMLSMGGVIFNHTAADFVWIIFAAVLAGVGNGESRNLESRKQRPDL